MCTVNRPSQSEHPALVLSGLVRSSSEPLPTTRMLGLLADQVDLRECDVLHNALRVGQVPSGVLLWIDAVA